MPKAAGATRSLILSLVLAAGLNAGAVSAQVRTISNEFGRQVEEPALGGTLPGDGVQALPVNGRFRDRLANTVAAAIESASRRTLSTDVHTPWQIMHALLGLRQDFRINDRGRTVSGLDWISAGPRFEGEYWFLVSEHGGKAHPYSKPYAFEGHANQSLAILSMLGLPLTHELKADKGVITIGDMVNHAKLEINDKEEVSWSLWALSRYLPPDATWQNKDGEVWNIDRMVELQLQRLLSKPMIKSPCGGTHAMFALAHARNIRLQANLPIRGVWLQADQQIRKCIELARTQQQPNGQFSTKFFEGRATEQDFDKRIASSGHILEFLMIALPQDELNARWVRRGIEATARDIMANRQSYVKTAPLYHAVNGLTIYLDRTQRGGPAATRIAVKPAALETTPKVEQPQPTGPVRLIPLRKLDKQPVPDNGPEATRPLPPKKDSKQAPGIDAIP